MLKHSKHKIVAGLFAVASIIIICLGMLFYTFSGKGSVLSNTGSTSASEFATAKADVPDESKEAAHFNIFSILNRFLSN